MKQSQSIGNTSSNCYDQAIIAVSYVEQLWSLFLPFSIVLAAHQSVSSDPQCMQGLFGPIGFEDLDINAPTSYEEAKEQDGAYIMEVRCTLGDWMLALSNLRGVALEILVFDFREIKFCSSISHPVARLVESFIQEVVQMLQQAFGTQTRIYMKGIREIEATVSFWQESIVVKPKKGPCEI